MKITKTKAWKKPEFMFLAFKEILDPWPVIKNSTLFALSKGKKDVSYCTLKDWGTCIELGTVVTKKKYRGKGYSSKLIKSVLKNHKSIYVVCAYHLVSFYNKFGFKKVNNSPYPIKQRIGLTNFFARLIGKHYVIMKK